MRHPMRRFLLESLPVNGSGPGGPGGVTVVGVLDGTGAFGAGVVVTLRSVETVLGRVVVVTRWVVVDVEEPRVVVDGDDVVVVVAMVVVDFTDGTVVVVVAMVVVDPYDGIVDVAVAMVVVDGHVVVG